MSSSSSTPLKPGATGATTVWRLASSATNGSVLRRPCGPCSHTTTGPWPARRTSTLRPPNSLRTSLWNMRALFSGNTDGRRLADLGKRVARPPFVLPVREPVAQLWHHLAGEARGVVEHGLVRHVAVVHEQHEVADL